MYEQVEKPKENRSREVANSVAKKKNNVKRGFGFLENWTKNTLTPKFNESDSRAMAQLRLKPEPSLIQLASTVKHKAAILDYRDDTGKKSQAKVGVHMEAILDPNDPLQGTSTPESGDLYKSLHHYWPDDKYLQGHLLNARLGGQGVSENLFPITQDANARHADLELLVKQLLIQQHENIKNGNNHYNVGYEVEMTAQPGKKYFDDRPDATIKCTIAKVDPATKAVIDTNVTKIPSTHNEKSTTVAEELDTLGWGYAKTASGGNASSTGSGTNETIYQDAATISSNTDYISRFSGGVPGLIGGRVRRHDGTVMSIELT